MNSQGRTHLVDKQQEGRARHIVYPGTLWYLQSNRPTSKYPYRYPQESGVVLDTLRGTPPRVIH